MLLLVAFAFLMLALPITIIGYYVRLSKDLTTTPEGLALSYLLNSVGEKLYYTNFGINFYLYVIAGRKFRNDLVKLFEEAKICCCRRTTENVPMTAVTTVTFVES